VDGASVVATAVAFAWMGMVLALSFIETPLKFRAPNVTLPIGLGIGRLVFDALGRIELVLGLVLALSFVAIGSVTSVAWAALALIWIVVLGQRFVLRPRLAGRTDAVIRGEQVPPATYHLWFVALDVIKVVLLAVLGSAIMLGIPT